MPSGISYCDETWNPLAGCSAVSVACEQCWACRLVATRLDRLPDYHGLARQTEKGRYQWTGEVRLLPHKLDQPLHWRKPRTIFVCSQADLFHEAVPDGFIDQVFAVMALAPQHRFLVLTKRPERMQNNLLSYFDEPKGLHGATKIYNALLKVVVGQSRSLIPVVESALDNFTWPLPNVWLGVTVENQEEADHRIPLLLQAPAAKRWVSIEPMLGQVDLAAFVGCNCGGGPWVAPEAHLKSCPEYILNRLDWVVLGCESGPNPRPMQLDWVRDIRDQCVAAGVKFYLKQSTEHGKLIHTPFLDGRQWLEKP